MGYADRLRLVKTVERLVRVNTSETRVKTTVEWKDINWAKVQRKVFKLQKAIYKAAKSGQNAKARKLQKLLSKSYSARLLAVRRVTQDNAGKKTAGVDGVKSLTPQQRSRLVEALGNPGYKARPLRRVWIPKPGRDEKRPLGIPTIRDRVEQALVKLALEPQWEARFEGNSYGFRPGRSAHDAIEQIRKSIQQKPKYVLDADIAKCFDKIDHSKLLSKLDCPAPHRRKIKQWLKAGVMDSGVFSATEEGTPQGGVISPLLANIALDGMIREITPHFPKGWRKGGQPIIIRYADDFVVLHPNPEIIIECKMIIRRWLKDYGLELKDEKTRICHTLKEFNYPEGTTEKPGFNFLGFHIRQYPHSSKKGFTTIITPSDKAIKAHREAIKKVIKTHRTASQAVLINRLNPIIKGWCNYFSTNNSKETFSREDHILWRQLRAWTHSRVGSAGYKALSKYFSHGIHGVWTFHTENATLLSHAKTSIKPHMKVKGEKSPYDGDWAYWNTRYENDPTLPTRVKKLLKAQEGKCKLCGQQFQLWDKPEIDHIIPRSLGGKDNYDNLQLLHRHCHHRKTRTDGSLTTSQSLDENPF